MEATLFLANSAEQSPNGLVHALGIGWSITTTPLPGYALVVLLSVPWDQTNLPHQFTIALTDEDGHGVLLGQDEQGNPAGLEVTGEFEVGRPPGLPAGTPIEQAMTWNLGPGMPLPPGAYSWRLRIDGDDVTSAGFLVRLPEVTSN